MLTSSKNGPSKINLKVKKNCELSCWGFTGSFKDASKGARCNCWNGHWLWQSWLPVLLLQETFTSVALESLPPRQTVCSKLPQIISPNISSNWINYIQKKPSIFSLTSSRSPPSCTAVLLDILSSFIVWPTCFLKCFSWMAVGKSYNQFRNHND